METLCIEQTFELFALHWDFESVLQARFPLQSPALQEQVLLHLPLLTRLQAAPTLIPSPGLSLHILPMVFHSHT
jgi:hypothetical protein